MTVDGFKPPSYYGQPPRRAPSAALVALVAIVLVVAIGGGLAFALKIGPFAPGPTHQVALPTPTAPTGPGSTEAPMVNASPSSTLEPSISPTENPSPSHAPATPNSATEELLGHVPEGIRGSCLPTDFLEPIVAMVSCVIGDAEITVDYVKYPDLDSMYAAYNERVRITEIETDSGLCFTAEGGAISATPNRWPAERLYNVAGQPAGRYLCVGPPPGFPSINWTDDRLTILGVASSGPAFVDRLVTFWVNDAGPIQ